MDEDRSAEVNIIVPEEGTTSSQGGVVVANAGEGATGEEAVLLEEKEEAKGGDGEGREVGAGRRRVLKCRTVAGVTTYAIMYEDRSTGVNITVPEEGATPSQGGVVVANAGEGVLEEEPIVPIVHENDEEEPHDDDWCHEIAGCDRCLAQQQEDMDAEQNGTVFEVLDPGVLRVSFATPGITLTTLT
jgi:hypothetical protein